MDREALYQSWLNEEAIAHIHGWDFSHISGRYTEESDLPWNYRDIILQHLTPASRILDLDTGGGEFLLSLGHPHHLLAATEAYPPNVQLCKETLLPLGVDFRQAGSDLPRPWPDASFDMILNRHGDYLPEDLMRLLRPGGYFITQQVGAMNDRELVEQLLDPVPELPFPDQHLALAEEKLRQVGFRIEQAKEAFRPIRFFDVGALVWFARIIQWEFPGFSVDGSLDKLYALQKKIDAGGNIDGTIHRYLLVARKEA